MNTDKDGGNAFPVPGLQDDPDFNGLSVRDYFAAKAMQGWLSSYDPGDKHPVPAGDADYVAQRSYAMADAMLAARAKT
ncbi:hypothetical protein [Achromobacter sp. ACRQX]|uniref:hypothetical protein n=1 Tax=Achromobacter sp. ACRQX TaxID=2918181 RepID=UPI001EF2940E|nr:hypothetical protein [Achromobacter sp. ACRQX]MCG7328025.1 hypothetical protein [Achromobacter sp. ACRQX]